MTRPAAVLEPAPDPRRAGLAAPRPLCVSGREAVRSATLANGMRVIVWPVRNIPNVALYNWVRAGSRNERPGATGLAHFFEHMMFNGTSRHPPGEFDRLMEAQGGANNAFTSDDVTVYQDWFPANALELVLDLESDRVAHLAFRPEVIESERGVVASERRLCVEDNSHGLLAEQVQASAFVAHPYRFPTIGWPADIRSWTLQDLQVFYRTYYAPNNLTLALAGDVDPERAIALARRFFEPIPAQAPPPPVSAAEPEQLCERRVLIRRKAHTPLLHCAYKAPPAADPRAPAVSLLLSALVEGDASRLHRALVEDRQLAIEVGGHWQEGFDPGLLWLSLTLPEGADPEEARAALDAELSAVTADGVTDAELERARNLAIVGMWKKLATIDGKAQLLGEYEVFQGDWSRLFDAPARIAAVSAEELRAVAAEILDERRRTLGVLVPSAGGPDEGFDAPHASTRP
ncbi:MAG TPA: pitrilysin family protein [Steroidobacteraceae bacterium]|jgi:zinc protease|nr:pitrilysin family protein [Steroidobacteraceae bacterium]